jgi:hypothetical protein
MWTSEYCGDLLLGSAFKKALVIPGEKNLVRVRELAERRSA